MNTENSEIADGDSRQNERMVIPQPNAGYSTCPICGRHWLVTPWDDCLLPVCGCYGSDTSENNKYRPCNSCGLHHAYNCSKMKRSAAV